MSQYRTSWRPIPRVSASRGRSSGRPESAQMRREPVAVPRTVPSTAHPASMTVGLLIFPGRIAPADTGSGGRSGMVQPWSNRGLYVVSVGPDGGPTILPSASQAVVSTRPNVVPLGSVAGPNICPPSPGLVAAPIRSRGGLQRVLHWPAAPLVPTWSRGGPQVVSSRDPRPVHPIGVGKGLIVTKMRPGWQRPATGGAGPCGPTGHPARVVPGTRTRSPTGSAPEMSPTENVSE